MPSRRILTLGAVLTVLGGYYALFRDTSWMFWLLGAGVVIAMSAYIFQHQINWWWYQRYPPSFPQEMHTMFMRMGAFYQELRPELRKMFQVRTRLFIESKEFIAQGMPDFPEDVKYMIAYYAVMVSFGSERFTFSPYDRIVLYLHPFLSPMGPDHVHTYECEHEDGTLIFSLEQLHAGFLNPARYYQTGLHAFAELFARRHQRPMSLPANDVLWNTLDSLSAWTRSAIENFTGMPQKDPLPVLIHQWFARPADLQKTAPDLYLTVSTWLNIRPTNASESQ